MVLTPEAISAQLWSGPGAGSFYASAAALTEMAAKLTDIMDGQEAIAGVLTTAWASPTGESAIAANAPYQAWVAHAAAEMGTAATQISAAAVAFDAAQALTPTPAEFAQNDLQYVVLVSTNILGQNWPAIIYNRIEYAEYCIRAWTAMSFYTAESAGTVGAIQPLTPPPFSATLAPTNPSIAAGLAGSQSIRAALPAGAPMPMSPAAPAVNAALQPAGALASLQPGNVLSQPTNALLSGGSELAQAPSAMTSGLTGLGSQTAGAGGTGGPGADGASWIGRAPAAGGTVAAALSGGGAGLSGIGAAVPAGMRGPVSWSSTANAASPAPNPDADPVVVSRVAEARAAAVTPATTAGMGAPGAAMQPPAQQASEPARERERDGTLAAAVLYRPPTELPVVTGVAGARFVAGEEER
ncbi:PPE domain-containing protein [Mycobacterium sp. SP-6446]|uniref:PPE domain-containing protein n=1 Tax=Mycobacterium sp. SP-6446 TaxID=1834162 RepID=UPI00096C87A8|nr:PPE domain-containing protein [Mycobacterium sp. SP-6446]OMC13516.1 hypothetical protein A5736_22960 [Mycobacterium sp. SP-6446]